jgi:hypothetical protein
MIFEYQVLRDEERGRLRVERVRSLEADLCRIELALEDALSTAEKDSLYADAEIIRRRLTPHYVELGLTEMPKREGSVDGRSDEMVPPKAGGLPEKPIPADQLPTPG